jgi:hypothetical protein
MKEKVIDIYPPKEKERGERIKPHYQDDKKKKIGGKLTILIVFIFCLIFGYFYYASYKTKIVISPTITEISREENVLAKASGSIGEGEIRGITFIEKLTDSREFPIEGRKTVEKKAVGEIKVCQEYSDAPVRFVEATRFFSEEGKVFFAKEAFVLPAKKDNEGCAIVEVVAGESGEDYNISADSKFALPGLKSSDIYLKVNGVSFTLKEEGFKKEVPYLSEDAIERAEIEMAEELFQKGKEILLEKYGEEYFIENDAQYTFDAVRDENYTETDISEDAETFPFKLEVNVKVIGINKEEVKNFIKSNLLEGYTWKEETEEIKIDFSRINFEKEEGDVSIWFFIETYKEINKEEWKRSLMGLDFKTAKEEIKNGVEAEKVETSSYPFGFSKVAKNPERVDIVLQFDKN